MTRRMKYTLTGIFLATVCFVISPHARAQDDYFRDLESPREIAPVVQLNPEQDQHYNLAVGPLRFNVAAGVGLEYNDNINLSDHDRQSDFIFRPSLNVDSVWQLSEMNTLRFSMGVSYAKYFKHTEYDTRGVIFSPNSELAMTIMVGQVADHPAGPLFLSGRSVRDPHHQQHRRFSPLREPGGDSGGLGHEFPGPPDGRV